MSHDSSNVVVELVSEEPWLRDSNVAHGEGVQGVQVLSDEAGDSDNDEETQRDTTGVVPSDASSSVEQQSAVVSDESDVDATDLARSDATEGNAPPALVDEAAKLSVGSAEFGSNDTSPSASFIAESVTLSTRSLTSEDEVKSSTTKLDHKHVDKMVALANANRSQRSSVGSASISSGKSRLVPAGTEKWSMNRFSDDLLDEIFAPLDWASTRDLRSHDPQLPGGPLPAGIAMAPSEVPKSWFEFWRWHRWFVSLRLLSKKWNCAVMRSPIWEAVVRIFAPNFDSGRAGGSLFKVAHLVMSTGCAGCRISGNHYPNLTATPLSIRPTYSLGSVPLCQNHRREKPSDFKTLSSTAICWNCFQSDTAEACVLGNEDWGSFQLPGKWRGNTCRLCREAALDTEIRERWHPEGYNYKLHSASSAYIAESYLEEGEGDAADTAKLLVQDHWLRIYTSFTATEKQAIAERKQQRVAAQKATLRKALQESDSLRFWVAAQQGAARGAQLEEGEEDEATLDSESIYQSVWGRDHAEDWDEPDWLTQEDTDWLASVCLRDWLQHNLDSGVWQSPAEAIHKRLPTGSIQSISGLPVVPTDPVNGPYGEGQPITVHEKSVFILAEHGSILYHQVPPPPGDLAQQAEKLWTERVLEDTLRLPLNNIVAWIKATYVDYDAIARSFNLQKLLVCLRHRPFWQPRKVKIKAKLGGKQAPASFRVPCLPHSSVDVGHWTAMKIMTMWEEAQAPLRECACSVCTRSKRKRQEAELELLLPEAVGADELESYSSDLSEFSETEHEEEEGKARLATKANVAGGRLVKAPRI